MPARCFRCGGEAGRYYLPHMRRMICRDCLVDFYEKKVRNTVLKYGMLRNVNTLGIAVSGGKDSMALLRVMKRLFPILSMKAIYIHLGIPGYSDECEDVVRRVCGEMGVELIIHRVSDEGYTIPDFQHTPFKSRICGACGTVKRYHLNLIAYEHGIDTIATGHNLDDTVEVLFELYLRGEVDEITRIRPVSPGVGSKMAARIKPLIEMTEEENLYYVEATGTPYVESWCPLVKGSRMMRRKELIRMIEERIPGFRHTFFKSHVKRFLPRLEESSKQVQLRECEVCGMPTTSNICSYCRLRSRVLRAVEAYGKTGA